MNSEDIIKLFYSYGSVEDHVRLSESEDGNIQNMNKVFDKLNGIQNELANKKIALLESELLRLESDLDVFLKDYEKN